MSKVDTRVEYFETPGRQNTSRTLKLANKRAKQLGIRSVVVASTTGFTGVEASKIFKDHNLVVVTHLTGFKEPNVQELSPENQRIIISNGGQILTASHAFGTLGRAVRNKFVVIQIDEIIANTLKLWGEGVKVACEVVCMAADAGLIRIDQATISIGGTGRGADTAIVMKPSNTHKFFETKIHEIICKPYL